MTGGLMNLVSYGSANVIIHGNPKKTFFKMTYHKHTNFGMQRFRIDFEGQRNIKYNKDTVLSFKLPRYGDLIHDTYLVVNIPNIWSGTYSTSDDKTATYNFKWVDHLGTTMIRRIEILSGSSTLTSIPGEYLHFVKERDFSSEKKKGWDEMIGNIDELNNPAKFVREHYKNGDFMPNFVENNTVFPIAKDSSNNNYVDFYPHANNGDISGVNNGEATANSMPSIKGRKLYIPLECWFCDNSKYSIPLVAVQNQEIYVRVILRPMVEMYTILDESGNRVAPNPNLIQHQMKNFIHGTQPYNSNLSNEWNSDVHLISNYVFLSESERKQFAVNTHEYLVKQVYEHKFNNIVGNNMLELKTINMVSNYMWRFRRSDASKRNEWFNYTNFEFANQLPYALTFVGDISKNLIPGVKGYLPVDNPSVYTKKIMNSAAIIMDGYFREELFDGGVYNMIEKYARTKSFSENGIYHYNFCMDSSNRNKQPSGAMNVNKYNKISIEVNTITPELISDFSNVIDVLCNDEGETIAVRKENSDLYKYNFDVTVFEERFNVIHIASGLIHMKYAR